MAGIMSSNFVLNFLISSSLQELWGSLNVLQLLLHLPVLNLVFPVNCQILFSALI
jgi:hypothetical protein